MSSKPKLFTLADVNNGRIFADRAELVHNPPAWLSRGLQQTASGYGRKLNSGLSINFEGRLRRVYITQYSNAGSAWFNYKGQKIYVS